MFIVACVAAFVLGYAVAGMREAWRNDETIELLVYFGLVVLLAPWLIVYLFMEVLP